MKPKEVEIGGVIYVDAADGERWTCPDCGGTEDAEWAFHRCVRDDHEPEGEA